MVRRNNVPNPEPNGGLTAQPSDEDDDESGEDETGLSKRTGTEDDGLGELYD